MSQSRATAAACKSWLFTPATRPDRFSKAGAAGAGALIIDLEDAVAPAAKPEARAAALKYLEQLPDRHLPCALRINPPGDSAGADDLRALLDSSAQPDYIVIPKCESAAEVELVSSRLQEAGKRAGIVVQIETAQAMAALDRIAGAGGGLVALLFGAADMAASLGAEASWEPLLFVRSRIVLAAAVAGIAAVDSPYFHLADAEGLRRETQAAARLGFRSKAAIHPAQIAVVNAVLTPSAEEIAKARKIVAVEGQGAGIAAEQMVDKAVARAARLVLQRAGVED